MAEQLATDLQDDIEQLRVEGRRHFSVSGAKDFPEYWAVGQEIQPDGTKNLFIVTEDMKTVIARVFVAGNSDHGHKGVSPFLVQYICKLHNDALVAAGVKPEQTEVRKEEIATRLRTAHNAKD